MTDIEKVLECLNAAYKQDREAMHALMINRIPTTGLIDHDIIVDENPLNKGYYSVGCLGLINGILSSVGLPLVAMKIDQDGFYGFCKYE